MVRGPKKARVTDKHVALVLAAAKITTEILQSHGIQCAIFGSLAAKLYGAPRSPKDVDLLTIPGVEFSEAKSEHIWQEELKALIVRTRPHDFYLKDPKNVDDTFKILIFRPSPSVDYPVRSQEDIIRSSDPECKVDILAPGTMHLPRLGTAYIQWVDNTPLVPFSLLLVHKLQGWDDNRNAEDNFRRSRQHKDAKDVKKLLGLKDLMEALSHIGSEAWADTELFSVEFQALTKERVKSYARAFPSSEKHWRSLGFHLA